MVTMEKIYCIKCSKFRKSTNPKMPYLFDKTFVIFIICDKCGTKGETIFKEKNQFRC